MPDLAEELYRMTYDRNEFKRKMNKQAQLLSDSERIRGELEQKCLSKDEELAAVREQLAIMTERWQSAIHELNLSKE